MARAPPQRDFMEVHCLLDHPSEHITRATAKATGIIITGEWRPYVGCYQSKDHRHAVPKTDNRALERAALLYEDLVGSMESESTGGSRYVMMIVDDFSRFNVGNPDDEVFGSHGSVCFLPIHSGHHVRWTYQPGSPRRKATQDFSSTFLLRCAP